MRRIYVQASSYARIHITRAHSHRDQTGRSHLTTATILFLSILRGRSLLATRDLTRSIASMSKRKLEFWEVAPSIKRAKEIDEHTPYDQLEEILAKAKEPKKIKNVLHWFRSKDLRTKDNRGLHAAASKAEEGDAALITLYVHSPKDLYWHGTSPARTDFLLQTLGSVQSELHKDNIPLYIHEADGRKKVVPDVVKFIRDNDISHVYANYEYEIDELRRDTDVAKQLQSDEVHFEVIHDQSVVDPGTLTTGSGGLHKVYTPYWRTWISEIKANGKEICKTHPAPSGNTDEQRRVLEDKGLFKAKVPPIPKEKDFENDKDRQRIRKLWPVGYAAARKRLETFLTDKVDDYGETRSDPSADSTSRMSVYFNTGTVSMREVVELCAKHNGDSYDFGGGGKRNPGIAAWIREIVFREYYRQLISIAPHNSMGLPPSLKMANIEYKTGEEAEKLWKAWVDGKTGFPLVDAGMRQLKEEAWMHNRVRMNTASILRSNMLIDYRRGERFFAEQLIDWDLANNHYGWVPSYTLFNPISQAERNDPSADYIRKWVPELKDVHGKAIYMPYERMSKAEFKKLGYPEPCVDWDKSKKAALDAYKAGSHE